MFRGRVRDFKGLERRPGGPFRVTGLGKKTGCSEELRVKILGFLCLGLRLSGAGKENRVEHLGFRGWERKPGAGKNSEGRLAEF